MVALVQTMACGRCNRLVDVLMGRRGVEGGTGSASYDRDIGVCPECRGTDLVPLG